MVGSVHKIVLQIVSARILPSIIQFCESLAKLLLKLKGYILCSNSQCSCPA